MFDTPGILCVYVFISERTCPSVCEILCVYVFISECTCPSVCEKFYFKRMDIFSLNGEVHFLR